MSGTRRVPPALLRALAAPGGRCYRHCGQPVRPIRLASPLPGTWTVYACPSGVVSVTTYVERGGADRSPVVLTALRRWTVPPSRVRRWDLRTATRHGPELGPAAERRLARERPPTPIRVVYWRLYPFRGRDGAERRLFLCTGPGHRGPVFFTARPEVGRDACPRARRTTRRRGTSSRGRVRLSGRRR